MFFQDYIENENVAEFVAQCLVGMAPIRHTKCGQPGLNNDSTASVARGRNNAVDRLVSTAYSDFVRPWS